MILLKTAPTQNNYLSARKEMKIVKDGLSSKPIKNEDIIQAIKRYIFVKNATVFSVFKRGYKCTTLTGN